MNPEVFTAFYWGDDSLVGRHYYGVTASEGRYGHWHVEVKGAGYNYYRGYYANGVLREEGEIYVRFGDYPLEPQPDSTDVKWGKYYRPDGELGAEVRDGTGEQVLWYPDGKVRWRLALRNYKRLTHELWTEDGTLIARGVDRIPATHD